MKDLSSPGWQHHVGAPGTEYAVIEGVRVETAAIRNQAGARALYDRMGMAASLRTGEG